jgi:hypothetical protein
MSDVVVVAMTAERIAAALRTAVRTNRSSAVGTLGYCRPATSHSNIAAARHILNLAIHCSNSAQASSHECQPATGFLMAFPLVSPQCPQDPLSRERPTLLPLFRSTGTRGQRKGLTLPKRVVNLSQSPVVGYFDHSIYLHSGFTRKIPWSSTASQPSSG